MTYHYSHNYESIGPVSVEQLRELYEAGIIDAATQIFPEGSSTWTSYSSVNPRARQPAGPSPQPLSPLVARAVTSAPNSDSSSSSRPAESNFTGLVVTSWILLGALALLPIIPVPGFATWIIGVPIFIIAVTLGIMTLTRGGTLQGASILLAALVAVPLFMLIAPMISTAIVRSASESSHEAKAAAVQASASVAAQSSTPIETATPDTASGGRTDSSDETRDELTDDIIKTIVTGDHLLLASGEPSFPIGKDAKITTIVRGDLMESRGIGGTPIGTVLHPVKVTFEDGQSSVRKFYLYENEFHEWNAVAEPGGIDALMELGRSGKLGPTIRAQP